MKISKLLSGILMISLGVFFIQPTWAQSRTFDVGSFHGVKLALPGQLYLTQGSPQKVVIKASKETLEKIQAEVKGGLLVIDEDDWRWWRNWRGKDIKIYITAPTIEHVSVSGSGNIKGENTIRSNNMYVGVSGSGELDLEVETGDLEGKISGSGNTELRGSANNTEFSISGSGNIDAEELSSNNCEIHISGSGNCRVQVKNNLESRVSGSGNIYYRGNPDKVNNRTSGSGSVRKIG